MLEDERATREHTIEDKYKQVATLESKFAGMLEEEIQVYCKNSEIKFTINSPEERVNQE